ncbi:hypothetical protein [Haloarchaeobius sp. TZWSO28]|uniref:hypothetical protein n=1 Tax=Haloarchaeobius sp. TZWSO28 TaxID=3446119 RepID=UPI003EBAFDE2
MKRRALLSALAVGLPGCAAVDTAPGTDPNESARNSDTTAPDPRTRTTNDAWTKTPTETTPPVTETTTDRPTATDTATTNRPTPTLTAVPTSEPSPTVAPGDENIPGIHPSQVDCPIGAWFEHPPRVVCYPDHDDYDLWLRPSKDVLNGPADSVDFTLGNQTTADFHINLYRYGMYKYDDGRWHHLFPRGIPQPGGAVDSNSSHTWAFELDNTVPDGEDVDLAGGMENIAAGGMGGGEYAFSTIGNLDGTSSRIGLTARFTIDAPPIDVTPANSVRSVERVGSEVRVRAEGREQGDYTIEITAKSTQGHDRVRHVIPEQVLRQTDLRNIVPFFDSGVESVRLRRKERVRPKRNRRWIIEYRGEQYDLWKRAVPDDGW